MRSVVTVLVPAALRAHCHGARQVQVDATHVRDALAAVAQRYPALALRVLTRDGRLRPFVKLFLRERDVRDLEGLETPLVSGDTLAIVASVAGG